MNNDNSIFSRRQALAGMTLGGALVATETASALQPENQGTRIFGILNGTQDAARPPAFAGQHSILPLPFNAAKLNGISEKLITSHHDNNYAAAVKNLNKVEADLAKIGADTPAYQVAGLHERELLFRNSKTLHEAYFANLGGNGQRSGAIEGAISTAYGSAAAWETQFRATCMSLGGGSGWVVLAFELFTGTLRTAWSGNHTQILGSSVPLLVMDMYEHAYQMDFGAAHARYIDTFFLNINWDEANRRLEGATKAALALR